MCQECAGIRVHWTAGSVWDTYPYHAHEHQTYPWEPIGIENREWLRLRSTECMQHVTPPELICEPCRKIPQSAKFKTFLSRATDAPEETAWLLLSQKQLLRRCTKLMSKFRRRTSSLRRRLSDHQRLIKLIASREYARLSRILNISIAHGLGAPGIARQLERAAAGVYTPRGHYTEREMDLAFLSKSIGGSRLLFALCKAYGMAARSTLAKVRKIPRVLPSVGIPTEHEVALNISAMFDPAVKPVPPVTATGRLPGLVLQVDGVALEERCRYLRESRSVIGVCREHSIGLGLQVKDVESIRRVSDALHDPDADVKCHYGKDGTVVAIAPYARSDHYSAIPIVVSASCKSEKGDDLARWLGMVVGVWEKHESGGKAHGDVWALASDGDSAFRVAKHKLCTTEVVNPDLPLGVLMHRLPGLNCTTGKNMVIATCDPKHIIKRFATLLRNPSGISLPDHTMIYSSDILAALKVLPRMSDSEARELLNPADKQNVPKAVRLVQKLLALRPIIDQPPQYESPNAAHRRRMVLFTAEVMGYFVRPFIMPTWDLSTQIRSLITFAHLIAALWVKHGNAFFTGALYYDSQSIVKNLVTTVLRLQAIDPALTFYLILEGTDRLELLFGDVRTQDHSRNFDLLQLSEKLAVSALISTIFERNPDLDRGHRRLSLKDAMGVDHINPKSWIGDVRVGQVDIDAEWSRARTEANKFLVDTFGTGASVDFESLFTSNDHDLMRPNGDYIGVRPHPDDARTEANEDPAPTRDTTESDSDSDSDTNDNGSGTTNAEGDDEPDACLEEPIGVDLDEFLPSTTDDSDPDPGYTNDDFLVIDGKSYWIGSIVTAWCSDNRAKKVSVRPLRTAGVTLEDLRGADRWNTPELDGEDLVKSGDIVGSLVRAGGDVGLAVLEVTGFEQGRRKGLPAVNLADLEDPSSRITAVTQILNLASPPPRSSNATRNWYWNQAYLSFGDSPRGQVTKKNLVLRLPGFLVHPLPPTLAPPPLMPPGPASDLDASETRVVSKAQMTWWLKNTDLEETMAYAWESLRPDTADILGNVELLPKLTNVSLPYRNEDGHECLKILDVPAPLSTEKHSGDLKIPCLVCKTSTAYPLKSMRNHVGTEPCGWCGLDGCLTQLTIKGSTRTVASSCRYHYASMSYSQAAKYSNASPCTNVPIHCPFCPRSAAGLPRTIWKYNAMQHLILEHMEHGEGEDGDHLPRIPPAELMVSMHISRREEKKLNIDEEMTEQWRGLYGVPGSDAIEDAEKQLAEELKAKKRDPPKRRERAPSAAVVERRNKSQRMG
ncbi:hypothetical protein LXA43DRAFT_958147 [Ganoderma leucocontextum]|nr:hypothetical protein LXA43DRAFT_958147 [Ganoderma leucocontextum]